MMQAQQQPHPQQQQPHLLQQPRPDVNYVNNYNQQYQGGQGRNQFQDYHETCVVFVTEAVDKLSLNRRYMEVNAVMPAVPSFMHWSEQEISWSRADHPKVMPNPGGYALVVDPTLVGLDKNVRFTRSLIDEGSSINIMYKHTLEKLNTNLNMLESTRTTFHGIVPGASCVPMG